MAAPLVSDDAFIALWNQHHSAIKVANDIGTDARTVSLRRRSIERRHGIRLATIDHRPAYDQSQFLVTHDRVEVKMQVQDGVVLVINDQHFWPGYVPVMHRAFCYLAKKLQPFALIWNGDVTDMSTVSRWPSIGWEKKPTVKEELDAVKDRSHEVLKACPNAKRAWTAGNHDLRFETRLACAVPQYEGVHGIHLKDHFPEWHPAWYVTVNEGTPSHTEIRHRQKNGIHASYNNTKETGVTLVTGHDHRADVVPYDDRRGRRYGVRTGMGADSARDPMFVNYVEGRQCQWQSGFAVLTYKDGNLLCPELALKTPEFGDGTFQFRGEIISV
jgi:hypothetical protein